MISKRTILVIDSVLLIGILLSIFLLVGYSQPLVIAPLDSDKESDLLFYLPKTDFVLIDDNTKFDSPEHVFIGNTLQLSKGRHFIKFFDGVNSEVRQIDSEMDIILEFRFVDERVGVFNIGQRALNIETYDKGTLIGSSLAYTGGKNE